MINLQNLRLRSRLLILSLVVTLGILSIGGFALNQLQNNLLHDRQEKVRNLVESAHTVVAHYEAAARNGQSSVEEAQKAAASVVKAMRYEGNEYFWINDLDDRMVMHPIKPELDGKRLDGIKDKNGKLLFVEFNKAVKAQGAGFVDYLWPKPGQEAPAPKISYVKGFAPWGWVIGSGIYIDDVDSAVRQQAGIMGGMTLGILALLGLISWRISLSILRQIGGEPAYAAKVVSDIAGGDLTGTVRTDAANPGSLLAAMGGMQHKMTEMFREINLMAGTLSVGAEQLANASREVGIASCAQAQSTSSSAASIEELTVSIGVVSEIIGQTEKNSSQTATLAEDGATLVKETAHEIDLIAQTVAVSAEQIQALLERSQEIGGIANVIKEIADQTNLLALNAA
ncbi:MAG: methyl-accepting chemotaxis protein, partial [Rhodocyclaceae bacterium]